jgi:hypothetical protein
MKYWVKALLVYLAAMVIAVLLNEFSTAEFNAIHISFLGLFMYGSTVMVHHFTVKASEENSRTFPTYFMAITGLKMLAYLVALGIYVFIFKRSAIPVVVGFLAFYFVYTIMEVVSILKLLRSKD